MTLSLSLICYIIAIVCFVASSYPRVPPFTWNFFHLGWAFVVLGWILNGVAVLR